MDLIESYSEELKLIRKNWTKTWVWGIALLIFLMPLYVPQSYVYIATLVFIFTIGTLGQNLLIGFTGQVSFGQAGFLAIGAFSFGHMAKAGVPFPIALVLAGLICGCFGVLVGFPSLRLKGPYLAIVTLGFGVATYQILANNPVLSGGRMGLVIQKLEGIGKLSSEQVYFYMTFFIALGFVILTYNIVSSYMGRAFIAIRDNDIAAEVIGVSLSRYKLLSFAVSSFYVGVQGGLLALLLGYLEPNMFTFLATIDFLVAVVVGGLSLVEGSIMGAAFVVLIPQIFGGFTGATPLVFGIAIILVLIFEPLGLAGLWLRTRLYFSNWPFR